MRTYNQDQVRELLALVLADVDASLIDSIRRGKSNRDGLLSELDVLARVGDRLNARLSYRDPTGSG